MHYVLFKKVHNDHSRLRDDEIRGFAPAMPEQDHSFQLFAEPKDPKAALRLVTTSPVTAVTKIETDGRVTALIFNTRSGSTYQVELLLVEGEEA
jgi:hypothetical protein